MTKLKIKKNIVQDVLPKRSIRNVELPSRSRKNTISSRPLPEEDEKVVVPEPPKIKINKPFQYPEIKTPTNDIGIETPNYSFQYEEPHKSSKKVLYFSLFIFVVALIFGISALFKSATIKITPLNEVITFNEPFLAKKNNIGNNLGFQTVSLSKDVEKTVTAGSEQEVSKKASGTIIVYNDYNDQPQRLLINTRFQTPEGLIYKSKTAIVVPGKQVKLGKSTAGSVEVEVLADEAGEKYNAGMKDFTIPGLKGDPRYTKMYARSKTEMTGGFVGVQKTVSDEELKSADASLEVQLKNVLTKEISSQIPADFILYPESISYNIGMTMQSDKVLSGGAVLKKKGSATAVIFNKNILSKSIVSKVMPNISSDLVRIINLDKLNFSYIENSQFSPSSSDTLNFVLKGDANFVWVVDENQLKSDMLGLSKESALGVISKNKSIKEAWVETQPFWNKTIPLDQKKVKVVNTITAGF